MRGIFEFSGKVLPCPMFVVFPVAPEPTVTNVVDEAPKSHPGFRAVLPITEGQLGKTELGQFHFHPKRAILQENQQRFSINEV